MMLCSTHHRRHEDDQRALIEPGRQMAFEEAVEAPAQECVRICGWRLGDGRVMTRLAFSRHGEYSLRRAPFADKPGWTGSSSIFCRSRLIWTSTVRGILLGAVGCDSSPRGSPAAPARWIRMRSRSRSRVVSLTTSPLAPQFAARHVEQAIAEAHLAAAVERDGAARRSRFWTLQQQFPRLERLRQIIVAARHQAVDAVLGVGQRRQHQDRHACRLAAQRLRQARVPSRPAS